MVRHNRQTGAAIVFPVRPDRTSKQTGFSGLVLSHSAPFAKLAEWLAIFRRKPSSPPAFFTFPLIGNISHDGVTSNRFRLNLSLATPRIERTVLVLILLSSARELSPDLAGPTAETKGNPGGKNFLRLCQLLPGYALPSLTAPAPKPVTLIMIVARHQTPDHSQRVAPTHPRHQIHVARNAS